MPTPAEPILLLHGQPGSARDWDRVRDAIAGEATTIAFDRPGWDCRSAPTDLAGNARAALSVLDSHGVERATVGGHSFGGTIAAWLAAEYPERVGALVLAAPSANAASLNRVDRVLARPVVGPMLGAAALALIGAALVTPPLRARAGGSLGLDGRYLEDAGRALVRPAAWRAFASEQRTLIEELPSLEERLRKITAPTTIVIGTADWVVPPISTRLLAARIAGSEVVELARASHLLPQQRAEALAELALAAARRAAAAQSA